MLIKTPCGSAMAPCKWASMRSHMVIVQHIGHGTECIVICCEMFEKSDSVSNAIVYIQDLIDSAKDEMFK